MHKISAFIMKERIKISGIIRNKAKMSGGNYVVVTVRPWNFKAYRERISRLPGRWHRIAEPRKLRLGHLESLKPRYVFFPHWSYKVPKEITGNFECVCFHETDVPYGRGGSPVQNLIQRGHRETVITALRMTDDFDAGPVYLKRSMSLEGLAEEIFIRS